MAQETGSASSFEALYPNLMVMDPPKRRPQERGFMDIYALASAGQEIHALQEAGAPFPKYAVHSSVDVMPRDDYGQEGVVGVYGYVDNETVYKAEIDTRSIIGRLRKIHAHRKAGKSVARALAQHIDDQSQEGLLLTEH